MIGMDAIAPGTLVDNCYQIQCLLGQGGFGRTYLSLNTKRFNEPCVVKEFVPQAADEGLLEKSIELFRREAETLYRLQHPQIPKFLACFEEQGRLFLVSEYVNGKTYQDLLSDRLEQQQTFSEAEVVHWLRAMLTVLDYIHSQNIVHRDIAPDNIMLPEGQNLPVLIDFGVVKEALDGSFARGSRISGSSIVGKMGYASPEQMRAGQCSPSSDLYSLAATAVVLLTGRQPDELIDTYELEWRWQAYVQVQPALGEIINRMLADRPRDRYPAAKDVLAIIDQSFSENPPSEISPKPTSIQALKALSTSVQSAPISSPPPMEIIADTPADPHPLLQSLKTSAQDSAIDSVGGVPSPKTTPPAAPSATRQMLEQILQLAQQRFSGSVDFSSPVHTWTLFYCVGRFAWASNSYGANRQFCRLLQLHADIQPSSLDLNGIPLADPALYHIFLALSRRKPGLTAEKSMALIEAIVGETLFDLVQASQQYPLKIQVTTDGGIEKSSVLMAALVRPEQSVNSVTQIWKQWYTAGLGTIDPDQAPRIQYPDQLKQKVSANTYNTLQKVVDGQRTLREIGVLMKQKLQPLTSSLLPYLQQGLMTMNPVVDIAFPFFPEQAKASSNTPLVACIDDSPQICQIMKVILEREGYQFVAIRDSLRAVSILLNQKPALIFLDLVMPVANGYEVCAQIRRVSALKKTPVVILTGNDGVVDRIRANMVGATDFLSKPIDDKKVIKLLQQYCPI